MEPSVKKYRICMAAISFCLLSSLCFAQYDKPEEASKRANSHPAKGVNERIVALEKEGWEAIKKKDWNALGALMTENFVMVDEDGIVSGKSEVLKALADLNITDYAMEDTKVVTLDKDAALLTYKVTQRGTYKGQDLPSKPYYASSVYVKRGGKWLNALYQQSLSSK